MPVSWERALDLVAGELLRVKRDHGHDAIMAGSQGWGSAGIFHEARGQLRRFMGIFGGFIDQTSNYSFGTALVFLPHVLGNAQACTGPLTSWSSIARHARLMVMFGGANPKNMQVTKGGCGAHAIGQSLAELADAGVAVVNVSPIREDGPAAVAPEWIAIRPGTDTAMLLALTHTLIANGLHDADFLDALLHRLRARARLRDGRERRASRRTPTGRRRSPAFPPTPSARWRAAWRRTAP